MKIYTKILIVIITIIVCILAYMQNFPLIVKNPDKDFKPIEISQASDNRDNNMTLSFLYNLTKEKHPAGSDEVYKVKDYIAYCLEQMNVEYEIQSTDLDEKYLLEEKKELYDQLIKVKQNQYDYIAKKIHNNNLDEVIQEQLGYESFDEYFTQEFCKGKTIEELTQEKYDEWLKQYKNITLNNILVKLNSSNNRNARNILLCAHYDSETDSYGAGDDGIYVASLLESIRCLKDENYNNNIYILFTDGEELSFLGAKAFQKNNNIKFNMVLNFDGPGNSGNLILYHYSDDGLTKNYFKAVKKESSYSFTNDVLFNKESILYPGDCSDAFSFEENEYDFLDFTMIGNSKYYHSENDNFYNIDIKSLNKLTRSIFEIIDFYGNSDIEWNREIDCINYKIFNGLEFSINKTIYIAVSIILIVVNFIYVIYLFKNHKSTLKRIVVIFLDILAILSLIIFKNFTILIILPATMMFILEWIKNKKVKSIIGVISFEVYLFIIMQPIYLMIQMIIWASIFGK